MQLTFGPDDFFHAITSIQVFVDAVRSDAAVNFPVATTLSAGERPLILTLYGVHCSKNTPPPPANVASATTIAGIMS